MTVAFYFRAAAYGSHAQFGLEIRVQSVSCFMLVPSWKMISRFDMERAPLRKRGHMIFCPCLFALGKCATEVPLLLMIGSFLGEHFLAVSDGGPEFVPLKGA